MHQFKDFGIKTETKTFTGEKIKIAKVLNLEITVFDFTIQDSIQKKGEKYLSMQIAVGDTTRLLFTGSKYLIEAIQKVPATGFPFTTKIVEDNERYEFT